MSLLRSVRSLTPTLISACRVEPAAAVAIGRSPLLRIGGWSRGFATEKQADEAANSKQQEAQTSAGDAQPGKDAGESTSTEGSGDEQVDPQELMTQIKLKEEQAAKLTQQV